jgi:hypothetical protein
MLEVELRRLRLRAMLSQGRRKTMRLPWYGGKAALPALGKGHMLYRIQSGSTVTLFEPHGRDLPRKSRPCDCREANQPVLPSS